MYLILIVVIIDLINGQLPSLISTDRLPGINELQGGFNAVSMVSASDQESKFRIFDMSEKGPDTFRFNIGNIDRVYNTPLQGQVTKINVRRDVACEAIATDFSQFYSNYFRSTRSTSGWSAFIIGGGTNTHETVKKVYDAMKKSSQAVGTSTSWWGLYSIQLGPPFILKLDPIFNASISAFVSRGSTPKTEADQSVYNMIVETYGTHYVTHVIMGATAHIYTFMNDSYAKSSSYEEITKEITRTSSFFFYQSVSQENLQTIVQNVSESFRKNSESVAVYQPPVATIIGKTEWQSWLANGPQYPVVVNRTLAPLSNLLYAYPTIQAYLRRTIDYYLTKGSLPTFAQLNP